MSSFSFSRLSLLWKILLSTSVAITALFSIAGWIVEKNVLDTTTRSLDDEVQASFQAYRSLWQARADRLASVSLILSTMSDVRAAFSTGDQATIRDTAGELWSKVSEENALFLVTDPKGRLIASLSGAESADWHELAVVPEAVRHYPQKKQASGFMLKDGHLYEVVVTPVAVQAGRGLALLDVLVAGYRVDPLVAQHLKESTGGSEFLFLAEGRAIASTLNPRATGELARKVALRGAGRNTRSISDGVTEYAPLVTPLQDIEGRTIGELWIFRSFENARERLAVLRRNIFLLGLCAVLAGLGLTYLLARRIVQPVETLDRAAAEVARQNYDYRVPVNSHDELGRLADTFNNMCASIQQCAPGADPAGAYLDHRAPVQLHRPRSAQPAGGDLRRSGDAGGFRNRAAATQAPGRQYIPRLAPHAGTAPGPGQCGPRENRGRRNLPLARGRRRRLRFARSGSRRAGRERDSGNRGFDRASRSSARVWSASLQI